MVECRYALVGRSCQRRRVRMALLWLLGFGARVTLLAIPPLIPAIHRDLALSETSVGALGGLPVLVLSAGALVGSLVVSRLGARRTAVLGLVVTAVAGAARGIGPALVWLFAMTIVMSVGVALTQLAIPSLVAAWEQRRIGRATAVYSNGILVGEIAGAGLTATVLVALAAGSWEIALGSWSALILLIAFAVIAFGPPATKSEVRTAWWPDWSDGRVWIAGLTLATASLAYWGANAHLPDYLHATGHGDEIPVALASLNGFQLPASVLLAAWPSVFIARRWPLLACGVILLAAVAALVIGNGAASGALAAVVGFIAAFVFVLALALPPLLARPNDVHRFSAGAFAVGYALAFSGSLIAGALWDATGTAATAFFPIVVAAVLMIVLSALPVLRTERAA
jgi:MFS transporter, CP family, cyanate transporter